MALPPVIERLKGKAAPSEIRRYVEGELFNWDGYATFPDLFSKPGRALKESSVHLAQMHEDDPYWRSAPKSQAFLPVLRHYLLAEIRKRPNDETVLWSLAGLDVDSCQNGFGVQYWTSLVVKDVRNLRWLVESALWVCYNSGFDTSDALRKAVEELNRGNPDFKRILNDLAESGEKGLADAARIALAVAMGGKVHPWLPKQPLE